MDVTVGDKVIRFFEPGKIYPATMFFGTVTHVDDEVITCEVQVDIPRTMQFDKRSGRILNGDCWDFILPMKRVSDYLEFIETKNASEDVVDPLLVKYVIFDRNHPDPFFSGARQIALEFPNGYGASIVIEPNADNFTPNDFDIEIAVLQISNGEGGLSFDTPIADDVLKRLTLKDVNQRLIDILALPTHKGE